MIVLLTTPLQNSRGAIRTAVSFLAEVVVAVESINVDAPPDIARHLTDPRVLAAVDRCMGQGTSTIIARPTVNIGTIQGGIAVNMIPDTCLFTLDIRLPIGLKAEQVLDEIRNIIPRYNEASITIEKQEAASNPASFSPIDNPMIRHIRQNAEVLTDYPPTLIPSMGATDCKHYRYASIPAFVYGCSPYSSKLCPLNYQPVGKLIEYATSGRSQRVCLHKRVCGGDKGSCGSCLGFPSTT